MQTNNRTDTSYMLLHAYAFAFHFLAHCKLVETFCNPLVLSLRVPPWSITIEVIGSALPKGVAQASRTRWAYKTDGTKAHYQFALNRGIIMADKVSAFYLLST